MPAPITDLIGKYAMLRDKGFMVPLVVAAFLAAGAIQDRMSIGAGEHGVTLDAGVLLKFQAAAEPGTENQKRWFAAYRFQQPGVAARQSALKRLSSALIDLEPHTRGKT